MNTTTTTFAVDVIDASGWPISYVEVEACFRYRQGTTFCRRLVTDSDGRARYHDRHDAEPFEVTIVAGRETSGPHSPYQLDVIVVES